MEGDCPLAVASRADQLAAELRAYVADLHSRTAYVTGRANTARQAVDGVGESTVDQWKHDLEIKHGMPADEIPGHVYILCFDEPRAVHSVSTDYPIDGTGQKGFTSSPIWHYVGWTQQRNPRKRRYAHGAGSAAAIVELERGTMADERRAKRERACPRCGGPLTPGQ